MKVLVSMASRHGATVEVGATIGDVLRVLGHEVHILAPDEVTRIDGYDAAVIGSGVYIGRWLAPARDLLARHRFALSRMPVWLFSSGPVGEPPKPPVEPVNVAALVALVGARGHRTFSGNVDTRRLSLGERALVAAVRAPSGDFRDWDDIEGWAREIASALQDAVGAA